ncbi:MAG: hypothetical protein MZV63_65525 [Marinilabiliales bacterium]|nr:hypothetical protein [Marinilabiliales bacterium]
MMMEDIDSGGQVTKIMKTERPATPVFLLSTIGDATAATVGLGRVRLQRRLPEARQLRPAPGRHRPLRQGQVAPRRPRRRRPAGRPDRPMTASLEELFRREPDADVLPAAVRGPRRRFPLRERRHDRARRGLFRALPRPGPGPQRGRGPASATPWPGPPSSRRPSWPSRSSRRDAYRDMLDDVARVGPVRSRPSPPRPAARPCGPTTRPSTAALDGLKAVIDDIPKGLIKERFVGGISNLYNILYVIGLKLRGPLL